MNAYGFERIKRGSNKDCYYHPFFLRDAPELMFQLYRMPSHSKKDKKPEKLSMFDPMFNLPALVPPTQSTSSSSQQQHQHQQQLLQNQEQEPQSSSSAPIVSSSQSSIEEGSQQSEQQDQVKRRQQQQQPHLYM